MSDKFYIILELLRSDGSIIVNKSLARNIGLNEAILYSELLSKFIYFSKNNKLDSDGYFFNTIENIEQDTTLTKRQQIPTIKRLEELGLIKKKLKDSPPKRYFKIVQDFELIMKYLKNYEVEDLSQLEQNVTFKSNKKALSKVTKCNTNNTNSNNTNFNKTTTEKNIVVVDESFIDNFIKEFKNKYNTTLNQKRLHELCIKSDKETLTYYSDNFNKFTESTEIKNKASFFYKAVLEKYSIPVISNMKNNKKVSQENNYQQRKYDDAYFQSLYENL